MDLIAPVAGIQARRPDLLPFIVREYDAHFGFDGLATRNKTPVITETKQHLFVEFKLELKKDFNHSFLQLEAIVCWSSRVKDGEDITDLGGNKATYKITEQDGRKNRFILVPGSHRNVEVIVMRELLKAHDIEFRPRGN